MSFDVVSLFTKVPVDLALQIAHARLLGDDTLDTRSGLSVAPIMSLLSLCLNATYFSYRGVFYKQVYGTAMGSPVSVVVANLVMEDIESWALSSFSPSPVFWKRYIDDVCCAVKQEDVTLPSNSPMNWRMAIAVYHSYTYCCTGVKMDLFSH